LRPRNPAVRAAGILWTRSGGLTPYQGPIISLSAISLYICLQPASTGLYGDLTGQTMTTDYKIDGTVTGPIGMKVRFYIGTYIGASNYFVTNDTFSWDPNFDTSWTTHQVALLAANFIAWPNQSANSMTFDQVVAAPEDIGLVFADGFTNNATLGFIGSGMISVDNFGVVPEPSSIIALVGGLGSLLAFRRRKI
jgi:hypothetical protein